MDPTDEYVGTSVRVCHVTGSITSANRQSYTIEVELAGVTQHVLAEPGYVHNQLGDPNE